MAVIVQKFGGTSVANAGKIRQAAQRAVDAKRKGYDVVVVVSARGHKTDELVDLAAEITKTVSCPTIGIGSGKDCDGNILVLHDLVGLFPWFRPKFATPHADLAGGIERAVGEFAREVRGD